MSDEPSVSRTLVSSLSKSLNENSDNTMPARKVHGHSDSVNYSPSIVQEKEGVEAWKHIEAVAVSSDWIGKEQALEHEKVIEDLNIDGLKSVVEARNMKFGNIISSKVKDEHQDDAEDVYMNVSFSNSDERGNAFALNVYKESAPDSQCKYGYIYVYDLPPMFNEEIISDCISLNVFQNVCNTLLNDGLGPSLGDASPLGQNASWFMSDQFTSEIVFHRRMLQHSCLTDEPEKATGFYVPYYGGLDVGRYLWSGYSAERRDRVGSRLLEWLAEQRPWKRNRGLGHFMMIGRISWDFRRSRDEDWGSGLFHNPSMRNMTRLIIEKNPWEYMEMGVPYPTNFHPRSDTELMLWQSYIRSLHRGSLFSFAGARRSSFNNDFRGILLDQCQQAKRCRSLDCSNRVCDNNQRTLELFMSSIFCLQPRGDSFTRRSIFDCLLAGTIPVFFWHRSAYMQYKWHLPDEPGSYSVFISKHAIRNGTQIEDVLMAIPPEKVRRMREVVISMIPRIVYAASSLAMKHHQDAFDVSVEGVMRRFKEELHLSPEVA
ncbi:hypothetical protein KP509_08G039400 [Ceratopteris richardii]|nr:hypothetical protein KP509_08G039400 [Ceratopteris richardii]